jgi:protease-4
LKLIDEFGGEREAVAWLERERGVAQGLPIKDWKKDTGGSRLTLFSATANLAHALGFEQFASLATKIENIQGPTALDGLLAIWQLGRDQ